MATRRRSITLLAHEKRLLIVLYRRRRIPIDQFESRPDELAALTVEWHEQSGRKDTAGELLHYMRSQRKRGLWVRFDGAHKSVPTLPEMSAEETEILVD